MSKYPNHTFVRVYPYDPTSGHTTKRCSFRQKLYREERGWYKVSNSLAQELGKVKANPYSKGPTPFIFQVCSFEEAWAIQRDEDWDKDPRRRLEEAVSDKFDNVSAFEDEKPKRRRKKKAATKKRKRKKTVAAE